MVNKRHGYAHRASEVMSWLNKAIPVSYRLCKNTVQMDALWPLSEHSQIGHDATTFGMEGNKRVSEEKFGANRRI